MRTRFFVIVAGIAIAAGSSAVSCSDSKSGAAPVCFDAGITPACTPAYEPTWDALYANTLHQGCAFSGVSCHASTGRQGGVDFDDIDAAYSDVTRSKIVAGKPECSVLVQRLISTDDNVRMPPARALSEGEQCAIVQWIAAGAHR